MDRFRQGRGGPITRIRRWTVKPSRCLRRLNTGLVVYLSVGAALAAGDPKVGAKLFLQCRACHEVTAAASSGVGPNLFGVVGAQAAKRPGYVYSSALIQSGLTWTPETLDKWLTEPTALVPGTKMAFAGIVSAKARQNVIAFLATLTPASVR